MHHTPSWFPMLPKYQTTTIIPFVTFPNSLDMMWWICNTLQLMKEHLVYSYRGQGIGYNGGGGQGNHFKGYFKVDEVDSPLFW